MTQYIPCTCKAYIHVLVHVHVRVVKMLWERGGDNDLIKIDNVIIISSLYTHPYMYMYVA